MRVKGHRDGSGKPGTDRRASKLARSIRTRPAHLRTGPRQVKRRNGQTGRRTAPDRIATNSPKKTLAFSGASMYGHMRSIAE